MPNSSSRTANTSAAGPVEKMSKSIYNVVNPDYIVGTLRRRRAAHVRDVPRPARTVQAVGHQRHRRRQQVPAPFLAAPSTTSDGEAGRSPTRQADGGGAAASLHRTIEQGAARTSRTSRSTPRCAAFMICLNELSALECNKRGDPRAAHRAARPLRAPYRRGAVGGCWGTPPRSARLRFRFTKNSSRRALSSIRFRSTANSASRKSTPRR